MSAVEKDLFSKPKWLSLDHEQLLHWGKNMKKFILGAVAAVALLVCSSVESNAQYPIVRGVRAVGRGVVRVAAPGPVVYGPRVVVARPVYPVYPVYHAPVVVGPSYGYYNYGGYGYGYGYAPGVSVGVGRVGVRVGY